MKSGVLKPGMNRFQVEGRSYVAFPIEPTWMLDDKLTYLLIKAKFLVDLFQLFQESYMCSESCICNSAFCNNENS